MPDDDPPQVFQPLPGRTVDRSGAYETLLAELLRLTGAEAPASRHWRHHPGLTGAEASASRHWRHHARRAVGAAVARAAAGPDAVPEEWFEPVLRAAVHEPDPSFVRDLVRPAVEAFGRRRVRLALIAYLSDGTAADAAGAARAWYWTLIGVRFLPGTRTLTPESAAEVNQHRDLDRRYLDAALRRFVADDDLDLRRCLLPGLSLRPASYPPDLQELVSRALEIARGSDDDYLRHRVEIQAD